MVALLSMHFSDFGSPKTNLTSSDEKDNFQDLSTRPGWQDLLLSRCRRRSAPLLQAHKHASMKVNWTAMMAEHDRKHSVELYQFWKQPRDVWM